MSPLQHLSLLNYAFLCRNREAALDHTEALLAFLASPDPMPGREEQLEMPLQDSEAGA